VLAAMTASMPVTVDLALDNDRVVVFFWRKPDAEMLKLMMTLANSDDVTERCTAARWLDMVGGRDALMQLLKMLHDPNARVRYYAAKSFQVEWWRRPFTPGPTTTLCAAPDGVALALARAVEAEPWLATQRYMLRILNGMHDPKALPILKNFLEKLPVRKGNSTPDRAAMACEIIGNIGGPEAEALLLAAVETLPQAPPRSAMKGIGLLGTDKAIAWLSRQIDIEAKKNDRAPLHDIATALSASGHPAAVSELMRLYSQPCFHKNSLLTYHLRKFDTPETQAAYLEIFKATTDLGKRVRLALHMRRFPAVRKLLFDELARGGATARRAALCFLRAQVDDPRIVPPVIEILSADEESLRADGMIMNRHLGTLGNQLSCLSGPEIEKALLALVKSDRKLRGVAFVALGESPSPKAHEALRAALEHPDAHVRGTAARALALRPNPADLNALLTSVRKEEPAPRARGGPSREVIRLMWTTIANIDDERAVKELMAEAANGNPSAISALMSSRSTRCVRATAAVLAGDDTKLRRLLVPYAWVSTLNGYFRVEKALADLSGTDEQVRQKQAFWLGTAQDPRGTEALVKLLTSAKESVAMRRIAAQALWANQIGRGGMADPVAVKAMRHALEQDTDEVVKDEAKRALLHWKGLPSEAPGPPGYRSKPPHREPPRFRPYGCVK